MRAWACIHTEYQKQREQWNALGNKRTCGSEKNSLSCALSLFAFKLQDFLWMCYFNQPPSTQCTKSLQACLIADESSRGLAHVGLQCVYAVAVKGRAPGRSNPSCWKWLLGHGTLPHRRVRSLSSCSWEVLARYSGMQLNAQVSSGCQAGLYSNLRDQMQGCVYLSLGFAACMFGFS